MKELFMLAILLATPVITPMAQPTIPPDNPLYTLKLFLESVEETIVSMVNPQAGLSLMVQHLHDRVVELYYLIEKNETYMIPELMQLIQNKVYQIRQFCETHNCTMTKDINVTIIRTIEIVKTIERKVPCEKCKHFLEGLKREMESIRIPYWHRTYRNHPSNHSIS